MAAATSPNMVQRTEKGTGERKRGQVHLLLVPKMSSRTKGERDA